MKQVSISAPTAALVHSLLRDHFDKLSDNDFTGQEIVIRAAKDFGFHNLAREMEIDLPFNQKEQLTKS